MINHDPPKNKVKITHFFNKIKIIQINIIQKINLIIIQQIFFHHRMKNIKLKLINNFIQITDLVFRTLTNQTFLNHTYEMNK